MSKSKYAADNSLAIERQRSSMRETEEWASECDEIADLLKEKSRPLRSKEIAGYTMLSQNSVRKRLEDLMEAGRVRERNDGPDARVTYYEHTDHNHVWMKEWAITLRTINELDGPVTTDDLVAETGFHRKKVLDHLRGLREDNAVSRTKTHDGDHCVVTYELK